MAKPKSRYSRSPAKGTKQRAFLLAALRPEGCDSSTSPILAPHLVRLRDDCGYDIRSFLIHGHGVRRVAYRLVGKYRWNGDYRSFITPE